MLTASRGASRHGQARRRLWAPPRLHPRHVAGFKLADNFVVILP